MNLDKKTVLITGGTSGIGLELARQRQQQGNTVIVTGRDQQKLDATSFTRSLRVELDGTSVTNVELAPPGVETPLFRGEFAEEVKGQRAMDVKVLVDRVIAGIQAGKLEIRPGLSNVLKVMSRAAPQSMFKQMSKVGKPKTA